MSASPGKQEPEGSHPPERGPCLPHEGGSYTFSPRTNTLLGRRVAVVCTHSHRTEFSSSELATVESTLCNNRPPFTGLTLHKARSAVEWFCANGVDHSRANWSSSISVPISRSSSQQRPGHCSCRIASVWTIMDWIYTPYAGCQEQRKRWCVDERRWADQLRYFRPACRTRCPLFESTCSTERDSVASICNSV